MGIGKCCRYCSECYSLQRWKYLVKGKIIFPKPKKRLTDGNSQNIYMNLKENQNSILPTTDMDEKPDHSSNVDGSNNKINKKRHFKEKYGLAVVIKSGSGVLMLQPLNKIPNYIYPSNTQIDSNV